MSILICEVERIGDQLLAVTPEVEISQRGFDLLVSRSTFVSRDISVPDPESVIEATVYQIGDKLVAILNRVGNCIPDAYYAISHDALWLIGPTVIVGGDDYRVVTRVTDSYMLFVDPRSGIGASLSDKISSALSNECATNDIF